MTKSDLIDKIVREVIYRIERDGKEATVSEGTAVLLASYVPGYIYAIERIRTVFGDDAEYIGFDGADLPKGLHGLTMEAEKAGSEFILNTVSGKEHVVLLSPSLTLLNDIVNGRDHCLAAYVVIRSLLWGKDVVTLLDFEPPRFKRNTLYEKTANMIGALEDAGIHVMTYKAVNDPEADLFGLVTESVIRDAHKAGLDAVKKAPGAIVTPAAKDAARQLYVRID